MLEPFFELSMTAHFPTSIYRVIGCIAVCLTTCGSFPVHDGILISQEAGTGTYYPTLTPMCRSEMKCIYKTQHFSTRAVFRLPEHSWYISGEISPVGVTLHKYSPKIDDARMRVVGFGGDVQPGGVGGSVIAGVGYEGDEWGLMTGVNLFKSPYFFPFVVPLPLLEIRHYPHEHVFLFADALSRPLLTRYPVRAGIGVDYPRIRAAVSVDQSAEFDLKPFDFLFLGGEASYLRDTPLGPEWAASVRISVTWSDYKPKSQNKEVSKEVTRTPMDKGSSK